ncbi:DUF3298 and DUF4163 domain-containing protein [Luteimonas suaedae]|uniref:DUF3298 and DUF4163 domain-containing protein n=1 Tax=Luteimonas suaedae TaxID=2605430 RepID=UPI0011ED9DD4|nr:DUF3298 and DUF4163 domain-containing protein [Luteimonas suaedae]
MKRGLICVLLVLAVAACQREAEAPQSPQDPKAPQADTDSPDTVDPSGDAVPNLEDVIEHDPRYVIGISYPPEAKQYPGLAVELHRYAQAAREELLEAVANLGQGTPSAPYDLSLEFSVVANTPRVVAIAADGSSYTGGAHGNPLVARFVWLPQQERLLRAPDLFGDQAGWQAVSDYVREQLHAELSTRVDAEDLEPAERSQAIRAAGQMIDEGSGPAPDNFEQFEPVMGVDGRIRALRFVFPPYQVGPYADGTRRVVVPADVLAPHLAPPLRELFASS